MFSLKHRSRLSNMIDLFLSYQYTQKENPPLDVKYMSSNNLHKLLDIS